MSRTRPVSAVVAPLAVALLLLAGCSSSSGGGGAASTGAPDSEATLRIAYGGPTQSLDPAKQGLTSSQPSTFLLYDRLTALTNDFTVEPMLAESWTPAPDGSYLELTLRRGVTFHDGTPFDGAAVKANIERFKTLPGSTVAAVLAQVQGVDVVDAATVRLRLEPGTGASLPAVLASNAGEMISPKALADGRDLGTAPGDAGSGPYLVAEYRPNELVVFERAPGTYWDPEAASPKRVEISYVSAASTRMNALRAGQLDIAHVTGADIPAAQKLVEAGEAQGTTRQTLVGRALYFRPGDPKFADARVRRAISHAVDREAIATQLLAGNATPLVQPYPPGHWANVPGLEATTAHDPELSKRLLAEAGASGLSFEVAYTAGSPSFEPIAQVMQSQLAEAGITMTLLPVPGGQSDAGFREGRFEAALNSMNAVADPQQQLAIGYLGGLRGGEAVEDRIAPLAARADDPALSQDQRGELYRQIWTIAAQEASVVNVTGDQQIWLHSDDVQGVEDMPWAWAGNFDARYLQVRAGG